MGGRTTGRAALLAISLVGVGQAASADKPGGAATKKGAAVTLPAAIAPLDRNRIPAPGPAPRVVLPQPKRFTFPSGARLLVMERHTLPMVAVAVAWPRGAGYDPPGREGLASLTASLLDEGAGGRGPLEMAAALQGLGTALESSAGWDSTAVTLVTLARTLEPSLALLADVVLRPGFVPAEVERVKAETLAALQQKDDSAQALANDRLLRAIYGTGQREGLPASGTVASVGKITRDDVLASFRALRMDQAIILVAGDVDAEVVRRLLERHFGAAALRPAGAPPPPPAAATPTAPERVVLDKPGAPQSEVRIGQAGPPRSTPDYFPLLVMNEILGGGDFSNRLNLNLREAHAFAYGAGSQFAFRRRGGPFLAATATKTSVTGPAIREALSEIERIRTEAVRADELRFARDSLQRSMARRFETLQDLIGEVGVREILGLPEDWFATFADKVEAVTEGDVLRAARTHLDPAKMSIVIVGDAAQLGAQLQGLPGAPFTGLRPPPPPVRGTK